VRTLCPACATEAAPTAGEAALLAELGIAGVASLRAPAGCDACNATGYRGRTGNYELLIADEAIRRQIHDRAPEAALRDAALRGGMTPLRRDGGRWVAAGTTSLAELVRVTREA
jgi:general secretion pathway protein E